MNNIETNILLNYFLINVPSWLSESDKKWA